MTPPIHLISQDKGWFLRPQDSAPQIDLFRRVYFLCEGTVTEFYYFTSFANHRKELNIHNTLIVDIFEKTKEHKGVTQQRLLLQLANNKIEELSQDSKFDQDIDQIIIVCDVDNITQEELDKLVQSNQKKCITFAFTNPSFELFLYLHDFDKAESRFKSHKTQILDNIKINKKQPLHRYFIEDFKFDPKKIKQSDKIGDFALSCKKAIYNESVLVNFEMSCFKNCLSSNVGLVLSNHVFNVSDDTLDVSDLEQPSTLENS